MSRTFALSALLLAAIAAVAFPAAAASQSAAAETDTLFLPSTHCATCHNNLTTSAGEDVSLGTAWGSSMMAHSARDPYWHAGVRRETIDHPIARTDIENECSRCHMPMAHVTSQVLGRHQGVFAHVSPRDATGEGPDPMALEGVSCSLCHRIEPDRLGKPTSFSGGFVVDTAVPLEDPRIYGPYEVDAGRTAVMRSATAFTPTSAAHVQRSELCATCHTLYTHPLDASGKAMGTFPEQMPYQEWRHSDFPETESCQTCHMPVVDEATPITSVLPQAREGLSRHDFRGANFFMLQMLNRHGAEQGVVARPAELDAAAVGAKSFLKEKAGRVVLEHIEQTGGTLAFDVHVTNLAGHKLPTAYPSRRVWLFVTVRDGDGQVVFSSGGVDRTGAIAGNDNDRDGTRFEPHYREIRSADQVQIYEAIMGTASGTVTTGLLSALSYLKDNRLLPRGFDKGSAPADVAVHGLAAEDEDFGPGEDRVRYRIDVQRASRPLMVDAQLLYQSIAFRWAENLRAYDAPEPRRFVSYYEGMAAASPLVIAQATAKVP